VIAARATARTPTRQVQRLVRFERVIFSTSCLFSTRVHIPTPPASNRPHLRLLDSRNRGVQTSDGSPIRWRNGPFRISRSVLLCISSWPFGIVIVHAIRPVPDQIRIFVGFLERRAAIRTARNRLARFQPHMRDTN
jgi:hypothetical protein